MDLRVLLLLVCASAAFTALSPVIYRHDPDRRKLFLAALAAVLLAAPWWSALGLPTWPIAVQDASLDALAQPVPWLAVMVWWSVGVALMVRTMTQIRLGRRSLGDLPRLEDPTVEAECRRIACELGLARPVSVRAGSSPCASSLGGLILVLPEAVRSWSAATRLTVLRHELAHLKRLDDRLMLLVRLLIDWYWWMPWLGSVHRRYVEAMEESCDDLACRLTGSRGDYATGLVEAARSLAAGAGGDLATPPRPPAWASLLGHSHFAVRVQRLVAEPRPTLAHADGRWALLWASLAFALAVTAHPSALPDGLPRSTKLLPLVPALEADPGAGTPHPRVETSSFVQDPRTGVWRPVPGSARDPLPVYPARALAQGLEGQVTVELRLRRTPSGLAGASRPSITSSDPTGVLAAAVARAIDRTRGTDLGTGLRTVTAQNNEIASPPPGTSLRLRTIYRFVLGTADPAGADPSSPGG